MFEEFCKAYITPPLSFRSFITVGLGKPAWVKPISFRFVCQSLNDLVMHHLLEALLVLYRKASRAGATKSIRRLVAASDNCAAQFKSKHMFLGLTALLARYPGGIVWLYGGAERFKWVHDTAGGLLKARLSKALLRFADGGVAAAFSDAASAVVWLNAEEAAGHGHVASGSAARDAARVVSPARGVARARGGSACRAQAGGEGGGGDTERALRAPLVRAWPAADARLRLRVHALPCLGL